MPPSCPPRGNSRCPLTATSVPDRSPSAGHRPSVGSDGCATDKFPRSDESAGDSRPHLDKSPWAYVPGCAHPGVCGQRRMWCRSAPRPSFPRTPIELHRCFATPAVAALCRRRGRRGVPGRVSPAGRLPLPASRTRQGLAAVGSPTMSRRRGCASRGFRVSTTAGTALHRTRTVIGSRVRPESFAARPETFATRGFSDLRTGFVLWDESSRRQRSRALHGSGRAAPEHGAGSPAPGTRPPPLEISRSTNCARISEEPDAGSRGREDARAGAGERQRVTRRHLGAYLDELVFRSNRRHNLVVAFGTLLDLGAMREPTTNDTITGPGTSRGSSARCYRSRPAGGSGATSPVRWPQHLEHHRRQPDRHTTWNGAMGERVPFYVLLFLPGAPQAGACQRVSARSPGVVVGPRVN